MTRNAGSKITSYDWDLPAVVTAFGNGFNSITATTFTDLPTTSCIAAITNPHPTATMVTLVEFGAWLNSGGIAVRCCPRVSGSVTIAAGIGVGGPVGWGEVPVGGNNLNPMQCQGGGVYDLPSGTATFTMQAFRDSASGTEQINYPVIRLIPLYYT